MIGAAASTVSGGTLNDVSRSSDEKAKRIESTDGGTAPRGFEENHLLQQIAELDTDPGWPRPAPG
jgi:hypothetical protein